MDAEGPVMIQCKEKKFDGRKEEGLWYFRQRQRQTDRQTYRQTETDRQTDRLGAPPTLRSSHGLVAAGKGSCRCLLAR
jgi:hypothetical protein